MNNTPNIQAEFDSETKNLHIMNQLTDKNTFTDRHYLAPICEVFNVSPEFDILQTSGGTGGIVPDPEDGGND